MSYTFTVSDAASAVKEEAQAAYTLAAVDAISSATVSGGSSSGGSSDGSDGGSTTMTADLIFDADLLTNALILSKLQVENEAADAIADRWLSDMSGYDAVIGEDSTTFYRFDAYRDAVEQAKTAGTYLSFCDYLATGNAQTTANRPYAVKYVLEDNLLGETQMNGNYLGKEAPVIYLTDETGEKVTEVKEGTKIYLSCDDLAYLRTVAEEAKFYVNGGYQELSNTKYALTESGRLLQLDADVFRLEKGSNTLRIKLDGYQDNTVSVPVVKDKKDVQLSVNKDLKVGDAVILTNDADESGDIWKYITKVSLKKPDGTEKKILPDGQESISDDLGYSISKEHENQLILGKDLFDTAGEYQVTIEFAYYEKQMIAFEISKADQTDPGETNPDKTKEPPKAVGGDSWMGAYTFKFGTASSDWIKNISNVSVNGQSYEKGSYVYDKAQYTISETDGYVKIGNKEITKDKNEIVISAEGYEDLTFYIAKTGKLVEESKNPDTEDKETPDGSGGEEKAAPEVRSSEYSSWDGTYTIVIGMGQDEWVNAIQEVMVNDQVYDKLSSSFASGTGYYLNVTDGKVNIKVGAKFESDRNEIVISANGYLDLTIILDQKGKILSNNLEAEIMLLSNELENPVDDLTPEEDIIVSDDNYEMIIDQDSQDSVESNDTEDEQEQVNPTESKDTNDSASNQLTDDDSSSEEAQNPDAEDNRENVAITDDKAEEQDV